MRDFEERGNILRAIGRARKYFASVRKSAEIFFEHLERRGNIFTAVRRALKYFPSFSKSAEIFCEHFEERLNILGAFGTGRINIARF